MPRPPAPPDRDEIPLHERGNYEGTYSHADREFVDQIMMHDLGTYAFRRLHTNDALSAGVRLEAIEAIRAGREDEVLTEDVIRRLRAGEELPSHLPMTF